MSDPIFDGVFDDMFAPGAHIGVGAADYSMTQTEYKDGMAWTILGGSRSGAGVNVPTGMAKVSVWRADPANAYPVSVRCGGSIDLAPGARVTIITDKNGTIRAAALGTAVPTTAWQAIDDDYTAVAGQHLDLRTLANGSFTVDLPLGVPDNYAEIWFSNDDGSLATSPVTVDGNGNQVGTPGSYTDTLTVNTAYVRFGLRAFAGKWSLI